MHSTPQIQGRPHASEWYQRTPFDPTVTFTVDDGNGHVARNVRYLNSPLDKQYQFPVGDSLQAGSLPPEDWEVRDHLLLVCALFSQLTIVDRICMTFALHSPRVTGANWARQRLEALYEKSPEHRAAFLRLSRSDEFAPQVQAYLRQLIWSVAK